MPVATAALQRYAALLTATAAARRRVPALSLSLRGLTAPAATTPTFAHDAKLPRLPIPPLQATVDKYLRSIEPLASESEMADARRAAAAFVDGEGAALQARLAAFDREQPHSWLEPIWLRRGYLAPRYANMINVNWWVQLKDHPAQDPLLLTRPPPKGVVSQFQLRRAISIIQHALDFRALIDEQRLAPETTRDGAPLDMHQYRCLFGANRVPGAPEDTIRQVWPSTARHIVVMKGNGIYKMNVVRPDGSRVSNRELEHQLHAVGELAREQPVAGPGVGILTAGNRDRWADAYARLCALDPVNAQHLETIHQALFAVCLDDYSLPKATNQSLRQWYHGDHAQNRWFDTCLQFIVANSGRAGLNGEHTPCDAMIPSRLFHHIVEQEHATDPLVSARHDGYPLLPRLEAPQPLTFRTDAAIDALIADAQREADRAIAGVEVAMLETHVYGARYMKEVAKTSPDSFVQMALQLAYYRLHGAPTAVYETAATRGFAHGRTETGRSLSSESLDFCAAFDNDDVSYEVKRDLLREAVAAHQQWMREAGAGHGIDRHFLGLAEMRRPDEPVPELLAQPVFARSKTFHLSTSNVSPGRAGYSGFGPGTADGYGCNYAIDTDAIRISISANRASRVAQPYRYGDELVRALKDLMILFAKPSEVWGKDWKTRHQQDRTHARDAAVMADLNRDYMRLESKLSEKYRRVWEQDLKDRQTP